jgi:hypothetical protein
MFTPTFPQGRTLSIVLRRVEQTVSLQSR